jgi:monovalent cation:proton antiporter-2 (CPA2) family protein
MHDSGILIQILLILTIVVASVATFQRAGFGSVLGFLIAGVILGPSVTGLISNAEVISKISEFGIVFLLFLIGLEIKPSYLWSMRKYVLGFGALQFTITGLLFTYIATQLGLGTETAILIGFVLAMSSTSIDLQILNDKNQIGTLPGRLSFSTLLFQDMMALPLLTLPAFLVKDTSITTDLTMTIVQSVLMIGAVVIIGKYLISPFLRFVAKSKSNEAFSTSSVLLVILVGWLMSRAGLPMSLGAFLAGMMLAESQYKHQIEADLLPFKAGLQGLFFMTVGMSINFIELSSVMPIILLIVASIIVFKFSIVFLIALGFKISRRNSFKTGVILAQCCEFALILVTLLMNEYQILDPKVGAILIASVSLTMLLTPIFLNILFYFDGKAKIFAKPSTVKQDYEEVKDMQDHIILLGYGRVGRTIAHLLDKANLLYTAVDMDPDIVKAARKQGKKVFYGDSTRADLLKRLGADNAKIAVIALDKPRNIKKTVGVIKDNFKDILIYARAKGHEECVDLMEFGAEKAIPETIESSMVLGREVLNEFGVNRLLISEMIKEIRDENYESLINIIKHEEELAEKKKEVEKMTKTVDNAKADISSKGRKTKATKSTKTAKKKPASKNTKAKSKKVTSARKTKPTAKRSKKAKK